MIYNVFAVRDNKVGFLTPTIDVNKDSAIRNFRHAFMRDDTLFHTHAKDFDLFLIGSFDSDSGIITPVSPEFVFSGADFLLNK